MGSQIFISWTGRAGLRTKRKNSLTCENTTRAVVEPVLKTRIRHQTSWRLLTWENVKMKQGNACVQTCFIIDHQFPTKCLDVRNPGCATHKLEPQCVLLCKSHTAIDCWSRMSRLSRFCIYLGKLETVSELFQYLAACFTVNLRRTPSREAEACFWVFYKSCHAFCRGVVQDLLWDLSSFQSRTGGRALALPQSGFSALLFLFHLRSQFLTSFMTEAE